MPLVGLVLVKRDGVAVPFDWGLRCGCSRVGKDRVPKRVCHLAANVAQGTHTGIELNFPDGNGAGRPSSRAFSFASVISRRHFRHTPRQNLQHTCGCSTRPASGRCLRRREWIPLGELRLVPIGIDPRLCACGLKLGHLGRRELPARRPEILPQLRLVSRGAESIPDGVGSGATRAQAVSAPRAPSFARPCCRCLDAGPAGRH